MSNEKILIGVIKCDTAFVSLTVHQPPDFNEIVRAEHSISVLAPQPGWFEQDPMEIIDAVYRCCNEISALHLKKGFTANSIQAFGITNQRETTIWWDPRTGKPFYNAIMWKDVRTEQIVDRIVAEVDDQNINHYKFASGLPLSTYFSALKIRWLKYSVAKVRSACLEGHCKFGILDSWIVWNLTNGALHVTDVTNASRTFLMNINTLQWDALLLRTFSVDRKMLPEIRSSSEMYGRIGNERCGVLFGKPITGIIGNHQAALLGQYCGNEAHEYAEAVDTKGDVYFVPALTGLYAPNWEKSARGLIIGLTQFTTKKHIVRAALEAICFQTRDIVECMYESSGAPINKIYVDGVFSENDMLMQLQADTSGLAVYRVKIDTISLGAALGAAQADTIDLFRLDPNKSYEDTLKRDLFLPTNTDCDRTQRFAKWKHAVERSKGWAPKRQGSDLIDATYRLMASIPAAGCILGTVLMVLLAGWGNK